MPEDYIEITMDVGEPNQTVKFEWPIDMGFTAHTYNWLVVWNIYVSFFFHILRMLSSQLTFLCFRWVETTNQLQTDPACLQSIAATTGDMGSHGPAPRR